MPFNKNALHKVTERFLVSTCAQLLHLVTECLIFIFGKLCKLLYFSCLPVVIDFCTFIFFELDAQIWLFLVPLEDFLCSKDIFFSLIGFANIGFELCAVERLLAQITFENIHLLFQLVIIKFLYLLLELRL